MATVSIQDFCAALYCAHASYDALPVETQDRIGFTVRTIHAGEPALLHVEFDGVSQLKWKPEQPPSQRPFAPGDHVELSVIEVEREPRGWRVWLNPWYTREVEFHCSSMRLNGAEVVGQGSWLQDELPQSPPLVPPEAPGAA